MCHRKTVTHDSLWPEASLQHAHDEPDIYYMQVAWLSWIGFVTQGKPWPDLYAYDALHAACVSARDVQETLLQGGSQLRMRKGAVLHSEHARMLRCQ